MLISCENCSTTYVLDDALIPPHGAPVQCTRCGRVFTARAPTPERVSAEPSGGHEVEVTNTAPSTAPDPRTQTMIFGAGSGQKLKATDQRSQTVMFGAPPPTAVPPTAAAPQPTDARNQTMMFGKPGNVPTTRNQTVMFGAQASSPTPAPVPMNQTLVFGAAPTLSPKQSSPSQPGAVGDRTLLVAMPGTGDSGASWPTQQHVAAGGPPVTGASSHDAERELRRNKTQLFAMTSRSQRIESGPTAEPTALLPTQNPAQKSSPSEPGFSMGATIPEQVPPSGVRRAILSAEEGTDPAGAMADETDRRESKPDSIDQIDFRSSSKRRLIIALAALFLAIGAAILFWYFRAAPQHKSAAAESLTRATEQAVFLLRRDDSAAQADAVSALRAIEKEHPGSIEAKAGLVLAQALIYDDLLQYSSRLRKAISKADRQAGAETEGVAVPLSHQINTLKAKLEANEKRVFEHARILQNDRARLDEMTTVQSMSIEAELAMLRARAMALAIEGDPQALLLADRFRARSQQDDNWADLTMPEYVANGGQLHDEAMAQLREIQSRAGNSTFLRPYVLAARINLLRGNTEDAIAALDQVVTMNDKHLVARELLDWTRSLRSQQ